MNRDDLIRKIIEKNHAIPQDLDKLSENELMELLDTDNPAYKDIVDTSFLRPYEEFDNLVDGDY